MANESTVLPEAAVERELRAVSYLRVSTKGQLKGFGLSSQRRKVLEHVTEKQWTHGVEYVDGGVSGSLELESRPGARCLMEAARRGEFDVVVVREARAIGRTGRAFWRWVWTLEDLGVFVSIVESDVDNTTADGRYRMMQRAEFSLSEWVAIRTRVQDGLQEKALTGGWIGGPPPYGYRIARKGEKGLSRLVVDPSESAVLRRAWVLIVEEGVNIRQAALVLNAERSFTRSGAPWRQQNLRSRLGSDAVMDSCTVFRHPSRLQAGESQTRLNSDGTPCYGETVAIPLPSIFTESEVLHLKVALQRDAIGRMEPARTYPLSGRIFNACGAHYVGQWRTSDATRMYRCSGKDEKYAGGPTCSCPLIDADAVEEYVWRELIARQPSPAGRSQDVPGAAVDRRLDQSHRIRTFDGQIEEQRALIAAVSGAAGSAEQGERLVRALTEDVARLRALREEAVAWQADMDGADLRRRETRKVSVTSAEMLRKMAPEMQGELIALWDVRVVVVGTRSRSTAGRPCMLRRWFQSRGVHVPRSLTDEAWARIEPLMPGNPRSQPYRQLVDGILYKAWTGVRWCDLPKEFGNHSTIHTRCARWVASGLWALIMEQLDGVESVPLPALEVLPPLRVETGRMELLEGLPRQRRQPGWGV